MQKTEILPLSKDLLSFKISVRILELWVKPKLWVC